MSPTADLPVTRVQWPGAVRIIRSLYPPIDLFEDIADPADWPLLIAAEQKTNPRLLDSIGRLDLVPEGRRVSGPGASYLMAPFTHATPDRPSRFSAGAYGVLYAGNRFEVALFETIFHHEAFMRATAEAPGWTSQFREIVLEIDAELHDLRASPPAGVLDGDDYAAAQGLGATLRAAGSDGVVYPSVRLPQGDCVGLFYPDGAAQARQGRHLDYHWNGTRVDFYRDNSTRTVFAIARRNPACRHRLAGALLPGQHPEVRHAQRRLRSVRISLEGAQDRGPTGARARAGAGAGEAGAVADP